MGIIASSLRMNGATIDATAAPASQPRDFTSSAFAIRYRQRAEYGYAQVSSMIHDDYASAGTAPAAAAANSAGVRPTTKRARK